MERRVEKGGPDGDVRGEGEGVREGEVWGGEQEEWRVV